jgi:ketosteroid isomerase-like protein
MNIHRLLTIILSAALPLSAFSQSSQAPDAAELTTLLKDFLAGASRNDIAMHDRFWADDLIYTSALGRRKGKADIMRELRAESATPTATPQAKDDETAVYTAEDIRIQQYGTTAIVAFRLVATIKKADKTEVTNYLNTGTFLKRDGKWQAAGWQATKMPPEAEPKK